MILVSASSLCISDVILLSKIYYMYLHISYIIICVIYMEDMTMDKRAEMPTCNLTETVHNKWLQQFGNKMTCLYEATVDDLICVFMQIANYISWLRGGSIGKGLDFASLKLKVVAMCRDPKLLADAMKSYLGLEDLYTRDCALEGFELFGSTKRKFDLPPGVDCDSHRPDKVNYYIPRPNTKVRMACIEECLVSTQHDVAHTTSVLETDCSSSHWHIARLPKDVGQYKPIQGLCAMSESELENMAHRLPRIKD